MARKGRSILLFVLGWLFLPSSVSVAGYPGLKVVDYQTGQPILNA
ncbi:MAG: hypothetical protein H6Q44_1328, partial [Deltaproteobacteria bacterium]|nr:hypothetical protein [Deltaproteobacteria bacterium]